MIAHVCVRMYFYVRMQYPIGYVRVECVCVSACVYVYLCMLYVCIYVRAGVVTFGNDAQEVLPLGQMNEVRCLVTKIGGGEGIRCMVMGCTGLCHVACT